MLRRTKHNPRTELTSDDIDGLYTVFPVCDGSATPESQGGPSRLHLGALRLWGLLLLPMVATVAVVLLVVAGAKLARLAGGGAGGWGKGDRL